MSDEADLLRAIRAAPEDAALRRVYADCLEEHGQGERAEFVRVQCELADGVADEERAEALREREAELLGANRAFAADVALVGIDSLNIDDPADPLRPAHHGLLGADIPIIEHLTNLESVPDNAARLTALPAPVRGMASFPVRVVAVVESEAG